MEKTAVLIIVFACIVLLLVKFIGMFKNGDTGCGSCGNCGDDMCNGRGRTNKH